jgi:hypothetical protein
MPIRAFREKYGDLTGEQIGAKLQALAHEFLVHEAAGHEKKREPAGIKN